MAFFNIFSTNKENKAKDAAAPLAKPSQPDAEVNNFVAVARANEVRQGQIHEVKVEGYKICLTKVGSDFYAFDAFCPHQGWMLWAGEMQGDTIRCDKHRWLFSVRTGATLAPSDMPIQLPVYPLRLENSKLLVDLLAVRIANQRRKAK